MQCHHFALDDFDGGEVKAQQAFLHAGELVERATTAAWRFLVSTVVFYNFLVSLIERVLDVHQEVLTPSFM